MNENFDSGISKKDMEEICSKTDTVYTSFLENVLVNLFTPPDALYDYIRKKDQSLSDKAKKMWKGKIEDYKRFILVN